MTKSILVGLVAVATIAVFTDGAYARGRRCAQRGTMFYNSPMWFSNAAPATTVQSTPMMTQSAPATANTGSSYQSYSYEPSQTAPPQPAAATTVAPVTTAPVRVYQAPIASRSTYRSEYNDVLRGDRKVRGHTAEGE